MGIMIWAIDPTLPQELSEPQWRQQRLLGRELEEDVAMAWLPKGAIAHEVGSSKLRE